MHSAQHGRGTDNLDGQRTITDRFRVPKYLLSARLKLVAHRPLGDPHRMKLWYAGVMVSAQRSVLSWCAQPVSYWVCKGFDTSDVKTSQFAVQVSFFLGHYRPWRTLRKRRFPPLSLLEYNDAP